MYEGQYKEYKWNWEGILDRADIERKRIKEEKIMDEEMSEEKD